MSDMWVIYPDLNTALHGVEDCDAKWGYPIYGTNLATGLEDMTAQPTTTWAKAMQRMDLKWCIPAPPDEYMPSTGYETLEEYDPAWFAFPPKSETAPVISGDRIVGGTAICSDGVWVSYGPLTYAYQWRRDNVDIAGETTNEYVMVSDDHYKFLTTRVTATNEHGSTPIVTPQVWGPIGP